MLLPINMQIDHQADLFQFKISQQAHASQSPCT